MKTEKLYGIKKHITLWRIKRLLILLIQVCGEIHSLIITMLHLKNYRVSRNDDLQKNITPEMMFDCIGIKIDSLKAQNLNFKANIFLTDINKKYFLTVKSGVVLYQEDIWDG